MNRKIQFRVWDIKQNKFLPSYGNLGINFYHEQGDSWHKKQIKDIIPVSWFLQDHNNSFGNFIVQQFTGLHDYNGVPIYEGDILEELTHNETKKAIGVCKSLLGGWKIFSYPDSSICWHGWKQRVVGNIYENPEFC